MRRPVCGWRTGCYPYAMPEDRKKLTQSDPGQETGSYEAADRCYVQTKVIRVTDSHGPFLCEDGTTLKELDIAHETYGELNADKSNAVMVYHALSGGAHAAFWHKGDKRPGWWDTLIGPGKPLDTDRFFIICANVPGSCYGSTGPGSIDPDTGKPYGLTFPEITVEDMVRAQGWLLDEYGIDVVLAVIGGSMGGMQALQFAVTFPERARGIIAIASTYRHSAQQIAFNEVGRQAIMHDPGWRRGEYYNAGEGPTVGLAIARMVGHVTYLSDEGMHQKFGRRVKDRTENGNPFEIEFEVASYLDYQGRAFTQRYDANAYLYLTKSIDIFDLSEGHSNLAGALTNSPQRFLLITYSSDWLYPPHQLREVARAVRLAGKYATYCEIDSIYGHDSFLLENPEQEDLVRGFIQSLERDMKA